MGKKSRNLSDKDSKFDELEKLDQAMDSLKQKSIKVNQGIILDSIPAAIQPQPDQTNRLTGFVKFYKKSGGWGIITAGNVDYFLLYKYLPIDYRQNLSEGQKISFVPVESDKPGSKSQLAIKCRIEPNIPDKKLEEQLLRNGD
jgi:cold shock CspA family protein